MAFDFSNEQSEHYKNPVDVHHFNPAHGGWHSERLYVPGDTPREARYWALELVNHLNDRYHMLRMCDRTTSGTIAYLPRTRRRLTDD